MKKGTHDYPHDPRNDDVVVYVNGALKRRAEATVNVLDSGFVFGDGVWEGIRLHEGTLLFAEEHLDRLFQGAKAIDMDIGMTRHEVISAIHKTLDANAMTTGAHVRLMITRGVRATPYQDPRVIVSGPTVVIIAEYKEPLPATVENGITLFTVHMRRGRADVQDPKLNSHSKLNCVLACIQAAKAGADEALMLDPHGFVSTCNSTNFFIARKGEVWTSTGQYCLNGVTRGNVIALCRANDIAVYQKNFSLVEVYDADEVFVTGTFAGVVPVTCVDGRTIGDGARGEMVKRLQALYKSAVEEQCR